MLLCDKMKNQRGQALHKTPPAAVPLHKNWGGCTKTLLAEKSSKTMRSGPTILRRRMQRRGSNCFRLVLALWRISSGFSRSQRPYRLLVSTAA
jgi:hypothetical protein